MSVLLAATATDRAPGWGTLAGLLLVVAVLYAGSCAWWPFAKCPKCRGAGRLARKDGRVFRLCPRCKASGRRLRIGRRVWNFFHHRRKAGTK